MSWRGLLLSKYDTKMFSNSYSALKLERLWEVRIVYRISPDSPVAQY